MILEDIIAAILMGLIVIGVLSVFQIITQPNPCHDGSTRCITQGHGQ